MWSLGLSAEDVYGICAGKYRYKFDRFVQQLSTNEKINDQLSTFVFFGVDVGLFAMCVFYSTRVCVYLVHLVGIPSSSWSPSYKDSRPLSALFYILLPLLAYAWAGSTPLIIKNLNKQKTKGVGGLKPGLGISTFMFVWTFQYQVKVHTFSKVLVSDQVSLPFSPFF